MEIYLQFFIWTTGGDRFVSKKKPSCVQIWYKLTVCSCSLWCAPLEPSLPHHVWLSNSLKKKKKRTKNDPLPHFPHLSSLTWKASSGQRKMWRRTGKDSGNPAAFTLYSLTMLSSLMRRKMFVVLKLRYPEDGLQNSHFTSYCALTLVLCRSNKREPSEKNIKLEV